MLLNSCILICTDDTGCMVGCSDANGVWSIFCVLSIGMALYIQLLIELKLFYSSDSIAF